MRGEGEWWREEGTKEGTFDIDEATVKACSLKLMQMDEKVYEIEGMDVRVVSGDVKFGTTSLLLSPTLLGNYGYSQADKFKVSRLKKWKIGLEKK